MSDNNDKAAEAKQSAVPTTTAERIKQLQELRAQTKLGGGVEAVKKQHEKGKLTARERVDLLMDEGSFVEVDAFVQSQQAKVFGDGVITGFGTINGRKACVIAQDFTVMGGSLGERHAAKICKMQEWAVKVGCPIISINDSGGARIQEGVYSLGGYASIFYHNVVASGVIPQVSAIMGPCAGGAVYSPALTDFIYMVKNTGFMFLTGPDVIRAVLNEDVTPDTLGGALVHCTRSGVAHFAMPDEISCINDIKKLLSYLPDNNQNEPPYIPTSDSPNRREEELATIIPDDASKPYDMKRVIDLVFDQGSFYEVQPLYAQHIIVGFARLNGYVVGIVANQPSVLAGCLDITSSYKGARFIRFCDAFNIPIVTLEDVPGFLPGTDQEYNGVIKHGAKLLYAYCEATVPKLQVVLRKSYGGAYCVMSSQHVKSDYNIAWPTAQFAVMGAQGAVNIIYRKEITSSSEPDKMRAKLIKDYEDNYMHPYITAGRGYIEDVIDPRETRPKLIAGLEMFRSKVDTRPKKKHGNIPL